MNAAILARKNRASEFEDFLTNTDDYAPSPLRCML